MKYIDIRVHAISDEDLASFVRLLSKIQRSGDRGSCDSFNVVVDGDGSGRFLFELNINKNMIPISSAPDPIGNDKTIWLGE